MSRLEPANTVEKGNAFRDLVTSMLEAASFKAESETREAYKKVDVRWRREDLDGSVRYFVEAKDYAGTLGLPECREFVTDYGGLVDGDKADHAWLISKGPISPDGRALIDQKRGCKAMTFAEFQRRILGLDSYLHDLVASFDSDRISEWYVPLHTEANADLEHLVRQWLLETDALPLAIVSGYGKGKSTFSRHLASRLATEALSDPLKRVPVLVPLGDIVDEQSLEGLLGKVFTTRPGVRGYNFGLFEKLNSAGRYVVIFDGFDEMKHGMTLARFEANITELMRLDKGDAKVLVLGRDTAFQDDYEFQSIIQGRQYTSAGQEVPARGRRAFREVSVRNFTVIEAKNFVARYFPIVAREAVRGSGKSIDESWLTLRSDELLNGDFDELLKRPVHAQMLAQIATDPDESLVRLSKYRLFDRFVHFLIDREVSKRGRDPRFSLEARRRFNQALAFWLWKEGGASTVTLSSVPTEICRAAVANIRHDYDETGLRKELTAGCLIEKGATGTIYFGHRSLQEFLVAEHLLESNFDNIAADDKSAALWTLSLITAEVSSFVAEAVKALPRRRAIVIPWFGILKNLKRRDMPRSGMRFFVDLYGEVTPELAREQDPWFLWLKYFAANRVIEFAPKTGAAVNYLSQVLSHLRGKTEQQAAVLMLLAEALASSFEARGKVAAELLAAWLSPEMLREVIGAARLIGRKKTYYVPMKENFLLWCFLHAAKVEGNPQRVIVDFNELRRRAGAAIAMGFAEEQDEIGRADKQNVTTEVQAIYRVWNIREPELDKVRPFFSDELLRSRILPLEIVRTRDEKEQRISEPPTKSTRGTLTLARRKAKSSNE